MASGHLLFLLTHVVSRYRQTIVIPLLLLGAHVVARGVDEGIRSRRAAAIFAAGAAIALILPWSAPEGYGYLRPAEYVVAADLYVERGATGNAVAELTALIRLAGTDPSNAPMLPAAWYKLGTVQSGAGRHEEAAESYREALKADPAFGEAYDALRQAEAAAAAERAKGERR